MSKNNAAVNVRRSISRALFVWAYVSGESCFVCKFTNRTTLGFGHVRTQQFTEFKM